MDKFVGRYATIEKGYSAREIDIARKVIVKLGEHGTPNSLSELQTLLEAETMEFVS